MATEEHLFTETMKLYALKGAKFTMDELAARLYISKKTLYTMVGSKEELAVDVVKYYFKSVDALQDEIHADTTISTIEKVKRLLCATPDFQIRNYHLHELRMNFPQAYQVLDDKLRLGWERTNAVIDQAKKEGVIREFDNQLFSKIYAAVIEEVLMDNAINSEFTFRQKQEQIVDMLLFGICI